jgi:hypothetical protein
MNSDPTEAIRREQLPIVNQPAVAALNLATTRVLEEAAAAGTTEVSDEEAVALVRRRDDLARVALRDTLVAAHGADNVFDTDQLTEHFEVLGFLAPFVVVRRKADGQKGSLKFAHQPRFYFDFTPDLG